MVQVLAERLIISLRNKAWNSTTEKWEVNGIGRMKREQHFMMVYIKNRMMRNDFKLE